MTIDRREFIVGASAGIVAPTLPLLPSPRLFSAASENWEGFMIQGWSDGDHDAAADQMWIRISNSWRTAWR